jgi:hypothetical protein
MTKYCPHCHRTLPLTAFSADRRRRDGRHSWCKACCRAARWRYARPYGRPVSTEEPP